MDENEAFIEGEYLEEIVTVDDNPGTSAHLHKNVDTHKHAGQQFAKKHDEDEFEEEDVEGQIIQGEDGEFYVLMDDDGTEDVELDDDPANVGTLITPEGDQMLVFQSNPSDPRVNGKRTRPARAILQDTDNGQVEMIQFTDLPDDEEGGPSLDLAVGAVQTAEAHDDHMLHHGMVMEPIPQGMKMRRTRVYGTCRCTECGQSFVNTARLERHLAVHQVFGSFLCPLCGKTYKYEYNLFYHWRRTCRDLNDLMTLDDRKTMDVNALRSLVDEVAQKKAEYGPIEIGISRSVLFQSGPLARLEMPANPLGRRGSACRACGVVVHLMHLAHHLNLHKGLANAQPDERSAVGGFYCDLCGLMFRQHFNLIKHWRTNCAEIQANLPDECELTLDDGQLKNMVRDLLKRASTNEAILDAESQRLKVEGGRRMGGNEQIDVVGYDVADEDLNPAARQERDRDEAEASRERAADEAERRRAYDDSREAIREAAAARAASGEYGGDEPGAVYADDFEDDELLMMNEDAIGQGGTLANRAKWNMNGGPIQCPECFRSFANTGRLERHMAGFHASHGSHHCALCGNRFKYDYNLLYHYRKSCPYTKSFIDRDVRDQMDAVNLRKLVRSLAQKDLRLTPQTRPMMRLPKPATNQSNDAIIRREMMRPILANAPTVLTQPRRGMTGKPCPICGVMFYAPSAIERHMNIRHGMDYPVFDEEPDDEVTMPAHAFEDEPAQAAGGGGGAAASTSRHSKAAAKKAAAAAAAAAAAMAGGDDDEAPPTLEMQQPGEELAMSKEERAGATAGASARIASGRTRYDSAHSDAGVQQPQQQQLLHRTIDARDVQEMYERGEIRDGDTIYVQEGDREVEYTVNEGGAGDLEEEEEEEPEMEDEEEAQGDEAEEAAYAAAEQQKLRMRREQQMAHLPKTSVLPPHQQPLQQRRYPAGADRLAAAAAAAAAAARPSTSAASAAAGGASAAGRKRPRNEERESSIWDDDLLEEDDAEIEAMQREVNARRAADAARGRGGGAASGSGTGSGRQLPAIMQRRP